MHEYMGLLKRHQLRIVCFFFFLDQWLQKNVYIAHTPPHVLLWVFRGVKIPLLPSRSIPWIYQYHLGLSGSILYP